MPDNDRVRVMVGNRGEKPSRLRDWILGRAPLDVPTDIEAFRAYGHVLMTPFHNMALMCPQTTAVDVHLHEQVFAAAVAELVAR